jgi:hypothetical protein
MQLENLYLLYFHHKFRPQLHLMMGRAIAQAVSRRLPTAEARVKIRVWSCGIL